MYCCHDKKTIISCFECNTTICSECIIVLLRHENSKIFGNKISCALPKCSGYYKKDCYLFSENDFDLIMKEYLKCYKFKIEHEFNTDITNNNNKVIPIIDNKVIPIIDTFDIEQDYYN